MLTVVARSAPGRVVKPVEIVRGQSSRMPWAWAGLCFAVPFHEQSNEGLRDVVNNVAPSTISNLTWTQDSQGNPSAVLGQTGYLQYPDNPTHDRPSTALTVAVRMKRIGTTDDWGGIISNTYANLSAPYSTWVLQQHSTTAGALAGQITNGTTDYLFGPTATIPSTEYMTLFLRWGDGVPPEIFAHNERGTMIATVGGISKSGALGYAAGMGIRINADDNVAENFAGHYSQALVWSRRLTDAELSWFVQDPFGWYSPRRETVSLGAPFPVGPGMAAQPMTIAGAGGRR